MKLLLQLCGGLSLRFRILRTSHENQQKSLHNKFLRLSVCGMFIIQVFLANLHSTRSCEILDLCYIMKVIHFLTHTLDNLRKSFRLQFKVLTLVTLPH